MGLNIKLIVHGVPQGQKVWGASGNETKYIESFYSTDYSVEEQMRVERFVCDGAPYIYYTLVRGKNVVASDGRAGSYFALTLRMDAYYADIQNMYNILSAAYRKTIVGKCVAEQEGRAKYLIADFAQVEKQLKEVENHITEYIGYFSNSSDLQPLSSFKQSATGAAQSLSLLDCEAAKASQIVKSCGRLTVSPFFPSAQMEQMLAQKRQELYAAQQQAQQQIAVAQQQAQQQVAQARSQIRQREEQMQAEMSKYKQDLQGTIDSLKNDKASLQKQLSEQKEQEARNRESEKRRADQLEAILPQITEALAGFRPNSKTGHGSSDARQGHSGGRKGPQPEGQTDHKKKRGSIFGNFFKIGFPVILLLCVLGMGAFQIVAQKKTNESIGALREMAAIQTETHDEEEEVTPLDMKQTTLFGGEKYQIPVKQAEGLDWTVSDTAVAKVESVEKEGIQLKTNKKGRFTLAAKLDGKQLLAIEYNVE